MHWCCFIVLLCFIFEIQWSCFVDCDVRLIYLSQVGCHFHIERIRVAYELSDIAPEEE